MFWGTCRGVHHPCSATNAQDSLRDPRQHATHWYQAVLILLDAPASPTICHPEKAATPARDCAPAACCRYSVEKHGVSDLTRLEALQASGSLYLNAVVGQASIQASLQLLKGHSWARHQRGLLQEQPRV